MKHARLILRWLFLFPIYLIVAPNFLFFEWIISGRFCANTIIEDIRELFLTL